MTDPLDRPPRPNSNYRSRYKNSSCFELVGRCQLDDPTWDIVHGTISDKGGGRRAHAWLKRDGWVHDVIRVQTFRAVDYIKDFAAQEAAVFSMTEAALAVGKFPNWGPWVDGEVRKE